MRIGRVVPIVEGHGEVAAVRVLLERIWREVLGGEYLEVIRPIRRPRHQLGKMEHLLRAVDLAKLKLDDRRSGVEFGLVLLLMDLDPDPRPACEVAPELTRMVREQRPHLDFACVLANPEYETWFVAGAESLFDAASLIARPEEDPERARSGKGWIVRQFGRARSYSEAADLPALTARLDLHLCRRRSASFDKLCRELEGRLRTESP